MPSNNPERHYDYRVARFFVAQGVITQDQYDAWVESQEDCAELGVETGTRMESSAAEGEA